MSDASPNLASLVYICVCVCHPICNRLGDGLEHVSSWWELKTILPRSKLHKGQTEHYGFILRLINLIMSLCARAQRRQQQRKVTEKRRRQLRCQRRRRCRRCRCRRNGNNQTTCQSVINPHAHWQRGRRCAAQSPSPFSIVRHTKTICKGKNEKWQQCRPLHTLQCQRSALFYIQLCPWAPQVPRIVLYQLVNFSCPQPLSAVIPLWPNTVAILIGTGIERPAVCHMLPTPTAYSQ